MRVDTSDSWKAFVKELEIKCQEQNVSLTDLVEWISGSIQRIKTEGFSYYISSGPIPKFPSQKIDVNILLGNTIYGFTVSLNEKEFIIRPTRIFDHYTENISKDFIQSIFHYGGGYLLIADIVANSARLREFAHRVLQSVRGMQ